MGRSNGLSINLAFRLCLEYCKRPLLRSAAVTFVLVSSFGLALAQTYQSTAVTVGFRDFSYDGGGVTSEPTEEKAESKLWFHDGLWWGVLWDEGSERWRIFKFDFDAPSWTNAGPDVDDRPRSSADVLSTGNTLYISSRAKESHNDNDGPATAHLNRYSYNSSTQAYTLDPGFPVTIPGTLRTRALTIAKDSNGKLWAVWTTNQMVKVNRTIGGDDTNWGTTFDLPIISALDANDLSVVTAFNGNNIGVLWSNQDDRQVKSKPDNRRRRHELGYYF